MSSVLVPLDNWAQHPAQQPSGICCFWEGTSCSGGDQPSRVRAGLGEGGFRVTEGGVSDPADDRTGLRGLCLQTPIKTPPPPHCSCQSLAAL